MGRQMQGDRTDPERILAALRELRSPFALYEQDIHQAVARRLTEAGLPFTHEKVIAPGCRIDFWCGGVGVEIKKGRPRPSALLEQLRRYAVSEEIAALAADLSTGLSRLQDAFAEVQVIFDDAQNAFDDMQLPETAAEETAE